MKIYCGLCVQLSFCSFSCLFIDSTCSFGIVCINLKWEYYVIHPYLHHVRSQNSFFVSFLLFLSSAWASWCICLCCKSNHWCKGSGFGGRTYLYFEVFEVVWHGPCRVADARVSARDSRSSLRDSRFLIFSRAFCWKEKSFQQITFLQIDRYRGSYGLLTNVNLAHLIQLSRFFQRVKIPLS